MCVVRRVQVAMFNALGERETWGLHLLSTETPQLFACSGIDDQLKRHQTRIIKPCLVFCSISPPARAFADHISLQVKSSPKGVTVI